MGLLLVALISLDTAASAVLLDTRPIAGTAGGTKPDRCRGRAIYLTNVITLGIWY